MYLYYPLYIFEMLLFVVINSKGRLSVFSCTRSLYTSYTFTILKSGVLHFTGYIALMFRNRGIQILLVRFPVKKTHFLSRVNTHICGNESGFYRVSS